MFSLIPIPANWHTHIFTGSISFYYVSISSSILLFPLSVKGIKTIILLGTRKKDAHILSYDTTGSITNLANATKANERTVCEYCGDSLT